MEALKVEHTPGPWESHRFSLVSKEDFFKFIEADKRDIMPSAIYRPSKDGGIYSIWRVQGWGLEGAIIGYSFSVNPKIGGSRNERYALRKAEGRTA